MSTSTRIRTAAVVLPVLLAALLIGVFPFALLVAIAAAVGVKEYIELFHPAATEGEKSFGSFIGGIVAFTFITGEPTLPLLVMLVGAIVSVWIWGIGQGPDEQTLPRWSAMLGGWLILGIFVGQTVTLRTIGVAPVFFLALVVMVGDSAAYFIGTAFGSRPLAPSISPNKSVEGALGSLVGSVGAGLIMAYLVNLPHGVFATALIAATINVTAQLGDLAESLMKRCAGVKDSGTIFPGHGGMLDRLDGFIFAAPLYALILTLYGV